MFIAKNDLDSKNLTFITWVTESKIWWSTAFLAYSEFMTFTNFGFHIDLEYSDASQFVFLLIHVFTVIFVKVKLSDPRYSCGYPGNRYWHNSPDTNRPKSDSRAVFVVLSFGQFLKT